MVTHIDMVNEEALDDFFFEMKQKTKDICPEKIPILVRDEKDTVCLSRMLVKEEIIPIFMISNKTGYNIDLFKNFLNLLPTTNIFQGFENHYTEVIFQRSLYLNLIVLYSWEI